MATTVRYGTPSRTRCVHSISIAAVDAFYEKLAELGIVQGAPENAPDKPHHL